MAPKRKGLGRGLDALIPNKINNTSGTDYDDQPSFLNKLYIQSDDITKVTFTYTDVDNGDGTITAKGTATGNAEFYLVNCSKVVHQIPECKDKSFITITSIFLFFISSNIL